MKNKSVRVVIFVVAFALLLYGVVTNLQLIYSGLVKLWNIFSTVITAMLLSFMLNVLMEPVERIWLRGMRKWKWKHTRQLRRGLAILITFVLTLSVLAIVLLFLVPKIEETVISLVDKIPGYIDSLIKWSEAKMLELNIAIDALPDLELDWAKITATINSFLSDGSSSIWDTATGAAISLINGVMNAVFSIIMSIYFLAQKERVGGFISRILKAFLPERTYEKIDKVSVLSYYVFSNFFSHQVLECLLLGVMCYIGMLIFGFPYALIISMCIAVTQLVPMVGPLIGEIIGAFILLMYNPLSSLLFLVFILVLQQVENSIVYPKIVGKSVGLPGLLTFVTVILGSKIGGLVGAFLGVPIVAVLYILLHEAVDRKEKEKALDEKTGKTVMARQKEGGKPAPEDAATLVK